jgi:hypothetical protein
MGHRVRHGTSGTDAPRLGADEIRRLHVSTGMGIDMEQDRPSGGTGGDLRGCRDQRVGAGSIPREFRGDVVLPEGRLRDASGGLSPEVGGGRDQGRDQYEIFGPNSRQLLDIRRSLRAYNTVGRGDGERLRTFAVSARRARCRRA